MEIQNHPIKKLLSSLLIINFCLLNIPLSHALPLSSNTEPILPAPNATIAMSSEYFPLIMKGVNLYANDPFKFDFILEKGSAYEEATEDAGLSAEALLEAEKLMKYFLAALTTPEESMWVNLSPYEPDRIVPEPLGLTEMGRDLIVQDYLLKQVTASLMSPDSELGQTLWEKIYDQVQNELGMSDVPSNLFNKVWIVPLHAKIYEHKKGAIILQSEMDVLMQEDYLSLEANQGRDNHGVGHIPDDEAVLMNKETKKLIKNIILPHIKREVNHGKTFSNLRQIYQSTLLAMWYKTVLYESIFAVGYANQSNTYGLEPQDHLTKEKVYQKYLQSFEDGVSKGVQEIYDPMTQEMKEQSYFIGGIQWKDNDLSIVSEANDRDLSVKHGELVTFIVSDQANASREPSPADEGTFESTKDSSNNELGFSKSPANYDPNERNEEIQIIKKVFLILEEQNLMGQMAIYEMKKKAEDASFELSEFSKNLIQSAAQKVRGEALFDTETFSKNLANEVNTKYSRMELITIDGREFPKDFVEMLVSTFELLGQGKVTLKSAIDYRGFFRGEFRMREYVGSFRDAAGNRILRKLYEASQGKIGWDETMDAYKTLKFYGEDFTSSEFLYLFNIAPEYIGGSEEYYFILDFLIPKIIRINGFDEINVHNIATSGEQKSFMQGTANSVENVILTTNFKGYKFELKSEHSDRVGYLNIYPTYINMFEHDTDVKKLNETTIRETRVYKPINQKIVYFDSKGKNIIDDVFVMSEKEFLENFNKSIQQSEILKNKFYPIEVNNVFGELRTVWIIDMFSMNGLVKQIAFIPVPNPNFETMFEKSIEKGKEIKSPDQNTQTIDMLTSSEKKNLFTQQPKNPSYYLEANSESIAEETPSPLQTRIMRWHNERILNSKYEFSDNGKIYTVEMQPYNFVIKQGENTLSEISSEILGATDGHFVLSDDVTSIDRIYFINPRNYQSFQNNLRILEINQTMKKNEIDFNGHKLEVYYLEGVENEAGLSFGLAFHDMEKLANDSSNLDSAVTTNKDNVVGGIDLNPAINSAGIQRDGDRSVIIPQLSDSLRLINFNKLTPIMLHHRSIGSNLRAILQ